MDYGNQKVIDGCCAGDRPSQEKLYQIYSSRMMGVCMWYAGNREEAEEILQDGFLRVFKYISKYKGEGSLDGWIRKIMVNSALLKLKHRIHLKPIAPVNRELPDVLDDASIIDILELKELVLLVQRLSPCYRIVFVLHVMHGMKHREIAGLLGISEGTSKSNLADARLILKKMIRAQELVCLPETRKI